MFANGQDSSSRDANPAQGLPNCAPACRSPAGQRIDCSPARSSGTDSVYSIILAPLAFSPFECTSRTRRRFTKSRTRQCERRRLQRCTTLVRRFGLSLRHLLRRFSVTLTSIPTRRLMVRPFQMSGETNRPTSLLASNILSFQSLFPTSTYRSRSWSLCSCM